MSNPATHGSIGIGKRAVLLFAAMAAAVTMFLAANPSQAAAVNYCGVYLQPYGQNGDRCWGVGAQDLIAANMVTYERAGCITVADKQNNLLQSWQCAAAGSAPAAAKILWFFDGVWRKPVIRNNNLSFKGYFAGATTCASSC